ncbi:MAG: EamA family transporter RarD, partial [Comamonas sp.]
MITGLLASLGASVLFAAMYYLAPRLAPLDGEQIFGWRVLSTLPFTTLIVLSRGQWSCVRSMFERARQDPLWGLALCASAALLGVQLWLFLWAPLQGRA